MKLKKIFVAFCAILMSTSLFACGDKNEEYIYKYSNENAALSALHYASQLTIMSVGSQMEEKDISSFKILSGNSNVQENYGNGRVYMTYQYTIRSEKIKVSQSFAVVNYGIVNIRGTESSVISDPKTEIACPNFNIDESGYINIKIVNKVYQEYLKTGKEDIREDIDIESSDGCFRYEINDEKTVTLYAGSKIENFTTITIPNTVKIGGRYYDVTAIGRNAFYEHSLPGYPNRNSKIKKVIFKNGSKLESIGDYAFYKCSSLTSIVIPSSVTSIGYGAFSDCSSLTSIVIPNSVISIGEHAFSGCNSLQYNEYGNCYYLWNDKNPYLVLVKAKDINITSATINENTKFIHSSAFSGCSSLTSIVIPISVTSIGSSAFYNCISLTIYCEASNRPSGWPLYWNSDRPVYWGVTPEDIIYIQDGQQYLIKNGEAIVTGYTAYLPSNVVIPNTIVVNGQVYNVSSIESTAFYGCSSLTTITIPSSVISIREYAFDYCTNLQTVTFESGSKLESIGEYAFRYCSSLTSIVIPSSVTSIGSFAFWQCQNLQTVTFENGSKLKTIGDSAFSDCSSLTSIIIPISVTSIGSSAFYNCISLTIYCEASSQPKDWSSYWNYSNRPVYWAGEWPNQEDSSQDSDEELLPDEIVGFWKGLDTKYSFSEFTIEISTDGSAAFKDETGEMELAFTFDEERSNLSNSDYYFAYNDNPEVLINIFIIGSHSFFSVEDDVGVINDMDHFFFYDYVEIEKTL